MIRPRQAEAHHDRNLGIVQPGVRSIVMIVSDAAYRIGLPVGLHHLGPLLVEQKSGPEGDQPGDPVIYIPAAAQPDLLIDRSVGVLIPDELGPV